MWRNFLLHSYYNPRKVPTTSRSKGQEQVGLFQPSSLTLGTIPCQYNQRMGKKEFDLLQMMLSILLATRVYCNYVYKYSVWSFHLSLGFFFRCDLGFFFLVFYSRKLRGKDMSLAIIYPVILCNLVCFIYTDIFFLLLMGTRLTRKNYKMLLSASIQNFCDFFVRSEATTFQEDHILVYWCQGHLDRIKWCNICLILSEIIYLFL